jgi:hypothetical protein
MPRWRCRVPKIARRAASDHMNDYGWENRSLRSRPVKPSPIRDPYRNRNQWAVLVQDALQRPLGGVDNSAAERLEARSPLPFNTAMDTRAVFGTHWVNLADTLPRASSIF